MNQFLSRAVFSGWLVFAVISPSGLWAQSWTAPSANPSSTVAPVSSVAVATPVTVPATPVVAQPSVAASVSTIVPAVTSVVTSVVTPVATVTTKKISAEDESPTLSEVVVTANRVAIPEQNVTSSSTILTSEEMEQKQASTVKDALDQIPGVHTTENGNPGETSSVFIRGNNPENTLVLYDGIPLNDPIGAPYDYEYLDGLDVSDVKQIEVLRGPQSTLWGSNAIGGVINIIPKSGPQPLGGSVLVEGGSYGTSREVFSAHGGDNGGYFNFDASHFNTAGFPALNVKGLDATDLASEDSNAGTTNAGDDNNTASLRLGSNLASNLEEKVLVRYSQSNTNILEDNSNFVLEDDPGAFALQQQFITDSRTDWKLLDGSWEQQLNISFSDDNRTYTQTVNPYNSTAATSNYDGQGFQAGWQNNIHFAKEETLVVGIQGQQEWGNSTSSSDSVPVTTVQTGSGYAESQTSIDNRLFFNLGGRWEAQSQYGINTTYQLGLAFLVPELETKLKANYGTGFLAPNLYQLYDPTYGNPNLQPETSLGFDFGFEQPVGGKNFITFGATYFDNDVTNLLSYNPSTYVSENIGKSWTYGVESFVEFKAIPNLSVKANYTYTYAWDQSDNYALLRRPQNIFTGDADYHLDRFELGASVLYSGSAFDNDFSGSYPAPNYTYVPTVVILPTYWLVNLRASYQVDTQVKLFARVDNLFNQWYETAYGYSAPGLSVYGGTKVSF